MEKRKQELNWIPKKFSYDIPDFLLDILEIKV